MQSVALKAYAKLNLGLAVLGRRPDGFHELRTIYQSISLADRLEVALARRPGRVRLEVSGFDVPGGAKNLAVRAAQVVLEELRINRQVLLRLRKRIPPQSGLGGASSDAAAVLRALLSLTGRRLPTERLLRLAAALGSDVPFFLFGGRALGLGRGEEIYPLPDPPRRFCVILFPGQGMETNEAYRRLRRPKLTASRTSSTIELFCAAANDGLWGRLENDFEPVVFPAFPQLAQAKKLLRKCGAEFASLSGSGSAVFGIFQSYAEAQEAARRLRAPRCRIFLAKTIPRREFEKQLASLGGLPKAINPGA